jgi:hypothetical protein
MTPDESGVLVPIPAALSHATSCGIPRVKCGVRRSVNGRRCDLFHEVQPGMEEAAKKFFPERFQVAALPAPEDEAAEKPNRQRKAS